MNFSLWRSCTDFLFLLFIPFVRRMIVCLPIYFYLNPASVFPAASLVVSEQKKIPRGSENPRVVTLCSSISGF